MAKPASGTGLDSGNSLYGHLTAAGAVVLGMLEGSGSTTADSSGNGNTGTLAAWATWGTNGAGDPVINCAAASGKTIALASTTHIAPGTSWSAAFRLKGNATSTIYTIFGRDSGVNSTFMWADDGNFGYVVPATTNAMDFTGATNWTTTADWLLVIDAAGLKAHLYRNGVEVTGSPLTIVSGDTEFYVGVVGSGYDGTGSNALVGTYEYFYLTPGYAASSADAANLHADPYSVFLGGGGGGGGAFIPNPPVVVRQSVRRAATF